MPQSHTHIPILQMLWMARPYLFVSIHLIRNGSVSHPQSPLLSVSYTQGRQDPSRNLEKVQISGADE